MWRFVPENVETWAEMSSRPRMERSASCSLAIHPSVRSSRAAMYSEERSRPVYAAQEFSRLLKGKPKVGGGDVCEVVGREQAWQPQWWLGVASDDKVHLGRQVLKQETATPRRLSAMKGTTFDNKGSPRC